MTMNKIVERLARNAADFALDGKTAKSNACIELLDFIKDRGLDSVRGSLTGA